MLDRSRWVSTRFGAILRILMSRPAARLIAAVSGGSNSLALLFSWQNPFSTGPPRRRGSGRGSITHCGRARPDEADDVAQLAARHGIAHRTHDMDRRQSRRPAFPPPRARRATGCWRRQRSLKARTFILTGHTSPTRPETVADAQGAAADARARAGRHGGGGPLFRRHVWIVRPLLGTRRTALRGFLREARLDWIDDPSNVSDRYERPRVRKALSEAEIVQALKVAADASAERTALGADAARLIGDHAHRAAPGLLRLSSDFFRSDHKDAAVYALRILLAVVGGTEHLPAMRGPLRSSRGSRPGKRFAPSCRAP